MTTVNAENTPSQESSPDNETSTDEGEDILLASALPKTTSRKRTTTDGFKSQHKGVKTTQKNKKPWIEENNDKDDEDEALYITQDTYSKPVDLEIPETSSKKAAPSKKRNTAGTKKTTPAAKKTTA